MKSIVNLIVLILLVLSFRSVAQNFNDALRLSEPGIMSNARVLGFGNANVAVSNDFSAVYYNPAGLGQIKNSLISGGLAFNNFKNNVTFLGASADVSNNSAMADNVGIVLSFPTYRGSLVFAAGYNKTKNFNNVNEFSAFNPFDNSMIQNLTLANDNIPFNLRLSYEVFGSSGNYLFDETRISGRLTQTGNILQEGSLSSWSFSGAIEIARNLFTGITLNVLTGEYKYDREYFEIDTEDFYKTPLIDDEPSEDFKSFYLNDFIDWDLSGWEMRLGLFYKVNKNLNFGATIKFPSQYTVRESYSLFSSSDFANRISYEFNPEESRIEYDISTPFEISGGASYSFNNFLITGQLGLIDYTQMEFTSGLDAQSRRINNAEIKNMFRVTVSYNIGVEYKLPMTDLKLRGGYFVQPSPFDNDPSDFDKKYITGGAGYTFNNVLTLDIGYAYGWWKTFGDNYGFNVSRTFQSIETNTFLLNVTYAMN